MSYFQMAVVLFASGIIFVGVINAIVGVVASIVNALFD